GWPVGSSFRLFVADTGFEPVKAMPADLQSAPVGRLGNLPMCTPCVHDWLHYQPFFVFANRAIGVFRHSNRRSHTISWRVLNHMVGSRFKLKIGRASCRERG